jgi:hypothetical protein
MYVVMLSAGLHFDVHQTGSDELYIQLKLHYRISACSKTPTVQKEFIHDVKCVKVCITKICAFLDIVII